MELLIINENLKPSQLPNFIEINKDSCTIFSNNGETFGIEILQGDANIYSVNTEFIEPSFEVKKQFNNDVNNTYTIFPLSEQLLICFSDLNGNVFNHQFYFNVYEQPEHYSDLLINQNLPDYEELKECIIFTSEFDKTNLVARMLLDCDKLLKYKGTITGIKKFLNFVGFMDDTFTISREYLTPENKITFTPNKATDIPTGNYSVWINNYIISNENKYNRKNLPNFVNLIDTDSIEEFIDKLRISFTISMKYFTLAEQNISYIGFNNMSNGMRFQSIAGNTNMIFNINPQLLAKFVSINVVNYYTSTIKKYVVLENIQTNNTIYKSEVKYKSDTYNRRDIFLINEEILDDEHDKMDLDIKRIFGIVNHIFIKSPDTYIEVEIKGIDNVFTYLKIPKQYVGDSGLDIKYVCTQSGRFNIKVFIWDKHNNREVYDYVYLVDERVINARFNTFTSHELVDKNEIDLDVTSSSVVDYKTENFVLELSKIPDDLSKYYDDKKDADISRYLTNNDIYKLPPINQNIALDNITELPIDFVDNFLHIITFPLLDKYKDIVIRPKSLNKLLSEDGAYFPLETVFKNENNFEYDKLFVTTMQVYEKEGDTKTVNYLFITTIETGIEIYKDLFDLALVDVNNNPTSIYEMKDLRSKKIPVNYDFPLFIREESKPFISYPKIYEAEICNIKSIFPRLLNVKNYSKNKSNVLKFGDVILASIDTDTITGNINMVWRIYNSFTNELLHSTNQFALKYRINENVIYNIELELEIDNYIIVEKYRIESENIVSSFGYGNNK